MAGAAVLGRLTWRPAEVVELIDETPRVRTIVFDVEDWPGHRAGQHVDVRLTADDGYQAQRSYSIASAADGGRVALTVERIDDGEVSPYLTQELRAGDRIELRGPVGGYFVWEPDRGGPIFLAAGGSGVVPLMSMARTRALEGADVPARLLYSARTLDEVIYREELERLATEQPELDVVYTLTRGQPEGWTGYARRVDRELLAETAWPAHESPLAYVCGPTNFVEAVAEGLVDLGYPPERVKTERFGATGGR